jgi:hypothetical protein
MSPGLIIGHIGRLCSSGWSLGREEVAEGAINRKPSVSAAKKGMQISVVTLNPKDFP